MTHLVQGAIIGFSIAAPVGPIGLLCIRRSLASGRLAGFVSGLGAATADALFGLVAALGLTAITQRLLEHRTALQSCGGLFLLYLGLTTLRTAPTDRPARVTTATGLPAAYFSTFALTLTNPMTILSFVGIFSGLGVGAAAGGAGPAALMVLGVFLGSATWWMLLSSAAGWMSHRLQGGGMRAVNVSSGLVIAGFGGWQLATLAWGGT